MARIIANKNTEVVFITPVPADLEAIDDDDINGGVRLTQYMTSFDNATEGNEVDTPDFSTDFETSIPGTYSATVSAEFYRDDDNDLAWDTLQRGVDGVFCIMRFGTTAGDPMEVYPVRVTSRSPVALANNESQRFNMEAAVPDPPLEDEDVPAGVDLTA